MIKQLDEQQLAMKSYSRSTPSPWQGEDGERALAPGKSPQAGTDSLAFEKVITPFFESTVMVSFAAK